MTSRPLVSVQTITGQISSYKVALPGVFSAPIRLDIVNFVHTNLNKNRRQAHGVDPRAGHKHSAESWGTGRAVARIPRVSGSGTNRSGQAAFGNMCRKGRMFAPLHTWRRWHRRVNQKQKRHAVASAIAASGLVPLVQARGHVIHRTNEFPLVVDNSIEQIAKTKQAIQALKAIGAYDDVKRVYNSQTIRGGKGKLRNKRFHSRKGPLVIYGTENAELKQGFRNVPGVDICHVSRLNLLQLAPGGQLGRFIIWTESAFSALNSHFGTLKYSAQNKDGYYLRKEVLSNADIPRIINSNEVQTVLKTKSESNVLHQATKKNPLKNRKAMDYLNPNAPLKRAVATKANQDAAKKRQDALKANRSLLTADQKKTTKTRKRDSQKWIKLIENLQSECDAKAIEEERAAHQAQLETDAGVAVGSTQEEEQEDK